MKDKKTAVLFPGQGSQEMSMGRKLAENQSQAMELWKTAEKICGHPLREIYWDGTRDDMSRTEYLQPALTVVNLNLWFFFKDRIAAHSMAGHSLGEYSALCAARVLEVEQTLKLVSLRGRLMAESGGDAGGSMAAVLKLEQAIVEEIADNTARQTGLTLIVANYNTPGQFVVSGDREAVEAIRPAIDEAKGRMVVLPVSGAFHSPLMNEAAAELARMMNKVHWSPPGCEIYFNSTAEPEKDPEKIRALMQKQMISPVYFMQSVARMRNSGADQFVELGPKGILSRMVPQILGNEKDIESICLSEPDDCM